MNREKLQQLHARFGMGKSTEAARGDLRDLVACFLEPASVQPAGEDADADTAVHRVWSDIDESGYANGDDVEIVLAELARLQAECDRLRAELDGKWKAQKEAWLIVDAFGDPWEVHLRRENAEAKLPVWQGHDGAPFAIARCVLDEKGKGGAK